MPLTPSVWLSPKQLGEPGFQFDSISNPKVEGLTDGRYIAVQVVFENQGSVTGEFFYELFNADGSLADSGLLPLGSSTNDPASTSFDIDATEDGGFSIVYELPPSPGFPTNYRAITYDSDFNIQATSANQNAANGEFDLEVDNDGNMLLAREFTSGTNIVQYFEAGQSSASASFQFSASNDFGMDIGQFRYNAVAWIDGTGSNQTIELRFTNFEQFQSSPSTTSRSILAQNVEGIDVAVRENFSSSEAAYIYRTANGDIFIEGREFDGDLAFSTVQVNAAMGDAGSGSDADQKILTLQTNRGFYDDGNGGDAQGYLVVWIDTDDDAIRMQRFDFDGNKLGTVVTIVDQANGSTSFNDLNIEEMGDGRVVVSWTEIDSGAIPHYAIVDPRGENQNGPTVISGISNQPAGNVEQITALRDEDTLIFGDSAFDPDRTDIIFGDTGDDNLQGGGGDDWISGGTGDNIMNGGGGIDTVSIAYQNVEWFEERFGNIGGLAVAPEARIDFFAETISYNSVFVPQTFNARDTITNFENAEGGDFRDTFLGTTGDNVFDGGDGDDTFEYSGGNDTFNGGEGGDDELDLRTVPTFQTGVTLDLRLTTAQTITGSDSITLSGVESIRGTLSADFLTGTDGNNDFNNGGNENSPGGVDTMIGLGGDDDYTIWSSGVNIVEQVGGGTDRIFTYVDVVMANHVENAIAFGDAALSITGNNIANDIDGNSAANTIDGGAGADNMAGEGGNDVFVVDNSGDVIVELDGEGDDTVYTTTNYNVPINVEVLIMSGSGDLSSTGTAQRDIIIGNVGNNTIDGGGGLDVMQGGAGNDTYAIDNSADAVIEAAGEGEDAVYSSVDYILAADQEIETGILTGAAVVLRGDDSNNQLFGNENVNVLEGKGGTDYLLGFGGDDIFQVSLESNSTDLDVFGDFEGAGVAGGDRIAFDAAIWGADGIVTQVSQTSFQVSAADGSNAQQFIIANLAAGNSGLLFGDDYYFA